LRLDSQPVSDPVVSEGRRAFLITELSIRTALAAIVHPQTGEIWDTDEDTGALLRIEPA
jgi:hypothetical protein